VPSAYWSVVELNSGILCASLPPLRPLIRYFFPGLSTKTITYEERTGKSGSRGARSSNRRSAAPGVYALRDVESSGSQEGLKDESASWYHREPEYAGHGATRGYQLRTNIQGGKAVIVPKVERRLPDLPAETDARDDVDPGTRPQQPRIMVTREIGFKEGSRRF
jgi:hypothetical protein